MGVSTHVSCLSCGSTWPTQRPSLCSANQCCPSAVLPAFCSYLSMWAAWVNLPMNVNLPIPTSCLGSWERKGTRQSADDFHPTLCCLSNIQWALPTRISASSKLERSTNPPGYKTRADENDLCLTSAVSLATDALSVLNP